MLKKTILFFLLIILQYLVECLPFGGVGNSGIGNYHGNWNGFEFDSD